MSAPLTPKQAEIYDFIQVFTRKHGYPPSVREIGAAVKLKSPSTVHFHMKKLEQEGFLVRTRSETDRRVVTLSLTEKGQAAMERFRQGMDRYLTMLDDLPQHMKNDFVRGVEAADKALDYLYEQGE